jgi:putative ABC transport system permease protein
MMLSMHDPGGRLIAGGFVLTTAMRDVVWRARRWVIASGGVALALSVSLLLSGFLASFHGEIRSTLDALGGDGYLVRAGAAGPFTTPAPVSSDRLAEVQAIPGVRVATPILTLPYTLERAGDDDVIDIFLVGRPPGDAGAWPVEDGRGLRAPGEVVLDSRAGATVGETVTMGGRAFEVVGTTSGIHVLAGKGAAWTSVEDAQALLFDGAPVVSGFLIEGSPTATPPDLAFIDEDAAKDDLIRLMRPVVQSISTFRLLMWLVAAAVIGSVLYLTAVERVRDFAVLKATGARDRDLAAALLLQSSMLAVVSSVAAIGLALVLAPTFPTPVLFSPALFLSAPAMAIVIGAAGSLAGVRRAMSTDPALAFGSS